MEPGIPRRFPFEGINLLSRGPVPQIQLDIGSPTLGGSLGAGTVSLLLYLLLIGISQLTA